MARIPYPDPEALSPDTAGLLTQLAPLNIFKMMSHADHLLRPFVGLGDTFLRRGVLDPVVREIAILRVGYLEGAGYETHQHEIIGRAVGMDEGLIDAVKQGPAAPGLAPDHAAVLAYADALVDKARADDAVFRPVLDAYGPKGAQELTLLIGYYMMVCRFLETFGVDIETDAGGEAALAVAGRTGEDVKKS